MPHKRFTDCFLLASLVICATSAPTLADATVSLKAVMVNGVPIPPTNDITVAVNDTITAEIKVFGWGNPKFDAAGGNTGLVRTYQVKVAGLEGVQSSGLGHGLVLPVGWDAPLTKDVAPCEDPCFTVFNQQYGCVGTTFNQNLMASIDNIRTDYLLFGFTTTRAVANDSLNIIWGGSIFDFDGQPDAGGSYHGGTLNLKAMPADACTGRPAMCGNFTFNLVSSISQTFISNPLSIPYKALPVLQSLVIHGPPCLADIGACCNGEYVSLHGWCHPAAELPGAGYAIGQCWVDLRHA